MSVFQQEPMTVDTVDIHYFILDTDIVETIPEGGDGEHSIDSRRLRMFSDIIIYNFICIIILKGWQFQSGFSSVRTVYTNLRRIIFLLNTEISEEKCCLVIKGVLVNESITVPNGIMMMFAAYDVFNIVYPEELGASLEFIQRSVSFIDPFIYA